MKLKIIHKNLLILLGGLLLIISVMHPVYAQDKYDPLFKLFDPSALTDKEIKFLQFALNIELVYNGNMDGKWDDETSHSLKLLAQERFGSDAMSIVAAKLYTRTKNVITELRWRWFRDKGIYFAIPQNGSKIKLRSPEKTLIENGYTMLRIQVDISDKEQMQEIHEKTLEEFGTMARHEEQREADNWTTKIELPIGDISYIKSQLVDGKWKTIRVQSPASGKNQFTGIVASISFSKQPNPFKVPKGYMDQLAKLSDEWFALKNDRSRVLEVAKFKNCMTCKWW
ncbi:hypothetical protein [Polycladidibacter stylochi]|uniref:hypothetical protein n=1 Tax=Polycladidibacter stylochi TaxID=1807766 RepID=UPI00082B5704|nr:hypothetical protein [Pseudovibrio stylochi]